MENENAKCCFACSSKSILVDPSNPIQCSLKTLCHILNLPVSIVPETLRCDYPEEINNSDVDIACWCHSCLGIIDQCQSLHNQIRSFESDLATLRERMKEIICRSFDVTAIDGPHSTRQIVKKSFVQCWKGWQVPLRRIDTCKRLDEQQCPQTVINPKPKPKASPNSKMFQESKYGLNIRKKLHDTKHPNNCKDCRRNFKSRHALNQHLNIHKVDRSSHNFICEICGTKYNAFKRLKIHQMRHESTKEPFACEDCGKCFSEPRTLKHHRDSVHANTYKYTCEICGIGCQQIYMLNRHMLCHTVEKNFECSTCLLKFKRKQQLSIHVRKHMREKPFKCEQCGKGFIEKKKLKNHEFVHKGEKPHQCTLCTKRFALKHYLKHHMNMSHKTQNKHLMPSNSLSDDIVHTNGTDNINKLCAPEEQKLQALFHTEDGLMLETLGSPKYLNLGFIHEPDVQDDIITYSNPGNDLHTIDTSELVVGEWVQFGLVQNM